MSRKNKKQGVKLDGGTPPGIKLDGGASAVDAVTKLTDGMTQQLDGLAESQTAQLAQIEAVDAKTTAQGEDIAAKLATLATGAQFSEIAERLDNDAEARAALDKAVKEQAIKLARIEKMGPGQQQKPRGTAFERALHDALKEYRDAAPKSDKFTREFELGETMMPFLAGHGFAGESTVIVDDGEVGDASNAIVRMGLTELIRDPVGLVDVLYSPPGVSGEADSYKEMVEHEMSSKGTVACALNGAITGRSVTAVGALTVHNTEGFFVGQKIYVLSTDATDAGVHGPHTISAITPGTTITFATNVIDYDCATGDLVCGEEFAATIESGFKPAGLLKADIKSVDFQTLATYLIMTRQRLRRTNLFDLAAWAARKLPERLREALEYHILYGSGTAPMLYGFLNSASLSTWDVSTDTWSTSLEDGGNRADLILWAAANIPGDRQKIAVLNKLDWWKITNAKNLNNDYVHGAGEGPAIIDTPGLKAVGGVRVIVTSKIVETYGMVFDPEQASSFVRAPDAEMVVGYVNDQLIQNQQTMLYEQSFAHLLKVGTGWRRLYFDAPPT